MSMATKCKTSWSRRVALTLSGTLALLAISLAGCRDSAPDDVIVQEETTEAIVFVKTRGEESLNRSWAEGNLYKLSPISPDGVVTPITNFTGAAVSDPCVSFDGDKILFSMRRQGDPYRNIWEINNDGTGLTRVSFNMSDDFDPTLTADGHIVYTRWDHFGTFNRFPLFVCNPDGSAPFHKFGPHNRNFFHAQATPDGRLIAIESTMINEDAGPLAVLKLEMGPADPARSNPALNWDVLTVQVNNDGAPWPYGAFKYPYPLGGNQYVASYTLPAAVEGDVDYGLYTFTLSQAGAGTESDPATLSINDLTFLYNDPGWNEYDAQLLAPREKPPVIPSVTNPAADYGVILANDIYNRAPNDGQEVPVQGVDAVDEIAVVVGIPTVQGEPNDFSANEFEKRALLGFAPVYPDGSFRIKVPADTPVSWATLDDLRRGFVVKRSWMYVRPGEEITKCSGCHQDRLVNQTLETNPNPIAATQAPTDLNIAPAGYTFINYRDHIGPIVEAKCASCHLQTYTQRDTLSLPDSTWVTVTDTIPPPGGLDLTAVPDTTMENQIFPRAYINLSGESEMGPRQVVRPAFPRRSVLIDYVLGVGAAAGQGPHPGAPALTANEKELFNFWVLLGAQYR